MPHLQVRQACCGWLHASTSGAAPAQLAAAFGVCCNYFQPFWASGTARLGRLTLHATRPCS